MKARRAVRHLHNRHVEIFQAGLEIAIAVQLDVCGPARQKMQQDRCIVRRRIPPDIGIPLIRPRLSLKKQVIDRAELAVADHLLNQTNGVVVEKRVIDEQNSFLLAC